MRVIRYLGFTVPDFRIIPEVFFFFTEMLKLSISGLSYYPGEMKRKNERIENAAREKGRAG